MGNDDFLEPPAPRKGDKLICGNTPDWENNAWLPSGRGGEIMPYIEGYLRAADILVQHVIELKRDQDFLVYPIIFLYRHHIELILKSLLLRTSYLSGQKLTKKDQENLGSHKLIPLWQALKPLIDSVSDKAGWERLEKTDLEGVDDYIQQLSNLDPESFSFRYAKSKKGNPSLPKDLTLINLRHFSNMMKNLSAYLDHIDVGFQALEEAEQT